MRTTIHPAPRYREAVLRLTLVLGLAAVFLVPGCGDEDPRAPERPAPPSTPYVLVLGTAQDGGFPQIGSDHALARAARRQPSLRRHVASLLIADPRSGKRWLIDATPDLREQVETARGHPPSRALPGPRPALFDGIFLTHGHMGHYTGLVHLGREAYGAKRVPVFGSARMAALLEANAPWSLLVKLENIVLHRLEADAAHALAPDLTITAIAVPHRAEFTDTYGFVIRGPTRSLLYIPDIDKWDQWSRRIEDAIAQVDYALLDGTFYADGEIPGRSMADIPHPFIEESMKRFGVLPEAERAKIHFTHLNHTNPASVPGGAAQQAIRRAGFQVAREGRILGL